MREIIHRIDKGIADSEVRIQEEVADYIDTYASRIGEQLAQYGSVAIPTFAGDFILTLEHLQEIAGRQDE